MSMITVSFVSFFSFFFVRALVRKIVNVSLDPHKCKINGFFMMHNS